MTGQDNGQRGPLNIILVEDSLVDAELVADALREANLAVNLRRVEEEAAFRAALDERLPDAILADWTLPRFSGRRALEIVRERCPEVPLIFVSGTISEDSACDSLRLGAIDYVYKDQLQRLGPALLRAIDEARTLSSLRESEEKYRRLFESSRDALKVLMPPSWRFTDANQAALQMFGAANMEELAAFAPWEVSPERQPDGRLSAEKAEEMIATAMREGSHFFEWEHRRLNGETFAADVLLTRMEAGGEVFLLGTSRDITERKRAEEEKSMLEIQLRHSQKMEAVGTLAGGIAHDFNNILNVIMGYGSMVYDSLDAGSDAKEQMNEVLIAAEKAANLTKRLLVFSRKNILEVKHVDINALILGLQKMLIRVIREDIDFTLELVDRPLIVLADTGLIEQALINLATNAKDAMQLGGRLTISTGLEEMKDEDVTASGYVTPGKYALITVADTGQGIDAETQKKIFEPFFTTKGVGEGTGLGLSISYGIIKQHGGYITVYSELGQGTVFKIYLPLTEETASTDMKTDAAAFPVKGGNETVLVAEDDASIRTLLSIVLESFGYSVISAVDGEDTVVKFMENRDKIQLVILDMVMPKKNGKVVGEAIRKINPVTKILFTSGYTMDILNKNELAEGGFDFICKPCPPRDLLIKVREILDR